MFLYIMAAMLYAESNLSQFSQDLLAYLTLGQSLCTIGVCLVAIAFEISENYLSRAGQAKLKMLAGRSQPDTTTSSTLGEAAVVASGELKDTFKVYKLHAWASRITDQKRAASYFDLDKWLSPICADDSPHSIYEQHPMAVMYRALVKHCPYLIDFVAHAPPELVTNLRRILFLLEQVYDTVGPNGLYAQQLEPVDQSSVFYWLAMWATPRQQQVFAEVVHDIHNCNTDTHACSPGNWDTAMQQVSALDCSRPKTRMQYPLREIEELLRMPEDQIDAHIEDKENRFLHLVTKSHDTGPRIRKIRSVMMTWGRGQVVKVAPFDQDDNMRQTQDNNQMENIPGGLEKNKIIADAVT